MKIINPIFPGVPLVTGDNKNRLFVMSISGKMDVHLEVDKTVRLNLCMWENVTVKQIFYCASINLYELVLGLLSICLAS